MDVFGCFCQVKRKSRQFLVDIVVVVVVVGVVVVMEVVTSEKVGLVVGNVLTTFTLWWCGDGWWFFHEHMVNVYSVDMQTLSRRVLATFDLLLLFPARC